MKRYFGWKAQQPDFRDLELKLMVVHLPESVDLRPQCPLVYDQGALGSCTAQGTGGAYEFEHIKQGLGDFLPSRLFIYYNTRKIEGTVKEDSGGIIRDSMKTIAKQGVCPESEWPYLISKFKNKPTLKCYRDALKDQVLQYMAVQQTPAQLKGCLAAGYPFVFGFTVYSSFMSDDVTNTGKMPMPSVDDSAEGGHCVLAVGYDDKNKWYIVRNSWSEEWGDKGYFYMPYDYLHDPNLCSDFWTIRKTE